jgi:hypothetical protein
MGLIKGILSVVMKPLDSSAPEPCFQCGFPPGKQMRVISDDPFLHPHECAWCHSVVYVPGLMVNCRYCGDKKSGEQAA